MDFLAGFIVGGLVWWQFVLMFIWMIAWGFSLHEESGLGFFALVAIFIYFFTTINITLFGVGVYMLLGVLWVLFKFRLHAKKTIDRAKKKNDDAEKLNAERLTGNSNRSLQTKITKTDVRAEIFRKMNSDTLFFWGIAWPFSVLGFFLYDFLELVAKKLIKLFGGYVDKLIDAADFSD